MLTWQNLGLLLLNISAKPSWDSNPYCVHFCHFQNLAKQFIGNDPEWWKVQFDFLKSSFCHLKMLSFANGDTLVIIVSVLFFVVRWISQIFRKILPLTEIIQRIGFVPCCCVIFVVNIEYPAITVHPGFPIGRQCFSTF